MSTRVAPRCRWQRSAGRHEIPPVLRGVEARTAAPPGNVSAALEATGRATMERTRHGLDDREVVALAVRLVLALDRNARPRDQDGTGS